MTITETECRSCGFSELKTFLSLGKTPLANSLLTHDQLQDPEPTFNLDLAFCSNCSLVQITKTVPPEKMFREYLYFSSTSEAMLTHARESVHQLLAKQALNKNSLVIEIASNDGYLLQYFRQEGVPVLGIEPAINIAKVATERGIPTLNDFFSDTLATKLKTEHGCADVIIGNNVLAHVPNLTGFVRGVAILLKDSGIAQFETPYVKDLIDNCEFDTVYHEHLCYYSLTALVRLFQLHGLFCIDVEHLSIHGGSLRTQWATTPTSSPSVKEILEKEAKLGVDKFSFYSTFASHVESLSSKLRAKVNDLKVQGKSIAAYGAAAKGSTLLNYLRLGADTISFVVDRNSRKQGLYMPGVHIPIYSTTELIKRMPDYTLLLTWNFAEEILCQQAEYRQRGGKFIIPIPEVSII